MYSINKQQVKELEFTLIEVKQKNIEVTFMDYGATILSIIVPDIDGKMETVLMGFEKLDTYIENEMYLNATVGPTSGRIANAEFKIDNTKYTLDKNFLGTENLHGGEEGLSYKLFEYEVIEDLDSTKVIFKYFKKEAESKYPGNQKIEIVYTVTEGELQIEFIGDTDKDTIMNLTNHAYFNLSGNMKREILDHSLFVNSYSHFELNDNFVPYIERKSKDTRFDFINIKKIRDNFSEDIYELKTKGIDEPFMLGNISIDQLQVHLKDNTSKRALKVYTTYPCIVIYTHNYPNELDLLFKVPHVRHLGVCFEAQLTPNGINIEGQDDSILRASEKYYHKTIYKFSVEE